MKSIIALNVFEVTDNKKQKSEDVSESSENDYLEQCIGAIGSWQICVSIAAILTRWVAMGNMTAIVFLTTTTDFICAKFKNSTSMIVTNNTCYDNCVEYVYHSDVMEKTLISDFDLICEREWLASLTQTILMFGIVVGASLFGWISDRFGRRIAITSATFLNVFSMICTTYMTTYWTFTGLRFITGIASGGCLIVCIPIAIEVFGKKYREFASSFVLLPDAIVQAALPLYAYLLPTWNEYLFAFSITCIIAVVFVCFIPESPRWLISRGRINNAIKIITRAAKFNGLKTENIRDIIVKSAQAMKIVEGKEISGSYADFFKNKKILSITISSLIIWGIIGITYYGIYQYMTLIGVNIYMTVVIMGLIQIPLCPFQIFITKVFSRRASLIVPLLITSVTMLVLIFIPKNHWLNIIFGVLGFAASSFCYVVVYLLQSELFPTPLRNMAFGLGSAAGKAGAMVAPFIAKISPAWIPSVIFAVLSIIAAVTCLLLPESKGKNLKDTID